MSDFKNRFSWSKSRHEKFEACRRQYFLHYYGSWGGWDRRAPAEVRELYLLKKLSSRYAWSGSAVHDAIRWVLEELRGGRELPLEQVVDRTRASMRAQFRESRDKAYRQRKAFGLLEHEYEEPISDAQWRAAWEQVERCLRAFYDSRWLDVARGLSAEQWLPIDQLGSFLWDETPVYAAPDFAYRQGSGAVLVDWKTGQPRDGDKEQLLGYALYAKETWGVPEDQIECRVVYLPSLDEVEVSASPEQLAAFTERMRASIEAMIDKLSDREKNVAEIARFPKTEDESACRFCPFRRPCGRA